MARKISDNQALTSHQAFLCMHSYTQPSTCKVSCLLPCKSAPPKADVIKGRGCSRMRGSEADAMRACTAASDLSTSNRYITHSNQDEQEDTSAGPDLLLGYFLCHNSQVQQVQVGAMLKKQPMARDANRHMPFQNIDQPCTSCATIAVATHRALCSCTLQEGPPRHADLRRCPQQNAQQLQLADQLLLIRLKVCGYLHRFRPQRRMQTTFMAVMMSRPTLQ